MRLDVVDGARVDPGVPIRLTQYLCLCVGIGGQHAVGAPVVVDRAAGDHRDDFVAVAAGVTEALEHHHAAAFGAGVSVSVGAERLDPAVRREHPAHLIETESDSRSNQRVHTAGQHHIGLARSQCLHTLVHRHQR